MKHLFLTCMLLITTCSFALGAQTTGIELGDYFKDTAAITATVVLVVDLLKNLLPNVFKGNFLKIFSWVTPVLLTVGGWYFKIGIMVEYASLWQAALLGVTISVASYFTAYVGILNIILQLLKIDLKSHRAAARK